MNESETKVSALFPTTLRDRIARSAQAHDRTFSAELREAARAYVAGYSGRAIPGPEEPGGGSCAWPAPPPGDDLGEAA